MNINTDEMSKLPIYEHLQDICSALKKSPSRSLVLTAETGAGKSTAVPVALLQNFNGQILMLEPRRIAVLNIAERVSFLLGEKSGKTCGYMMHLENKTSEATRFTVLTEAILTRKIQADPALEGVSVVVLDEFHERSLHADLALALLHDTMQIREDLYVLVMSATIDAERIAAYLGEKNEPCPIIKAEGSLFPVEVEYSPQMSVEAAVVKAIGDGGTILVFLPGLKEIRQAKEALEQKNLGVEIDILHSSVPIEEQRRILEYKGTDTRVILSSSIAETSVTVPGIKTVIDSGMARVMHFDQSLGMQKLMTTKETVFNAKQRTGRAGRTGPGKCIRLWNEHERLKEKMSPEILDADLSPLVLECTEWGVKDRLNLQWLDEPPEAAWNVALELLQMLGCVSGNKITSLGKACLVLGMHPRMACVVLAGFIHRHLDECVEIVLGYIFKDNSNNRMRNLYAQNLKERVQRVTEQFDLSTGIPKMSTKFSTAYALLYGYPDRIGMQTEPGSIEYQFPSGHIAKLNSKVQNQSKYIVAPELDAGEKTGRIYEYENLEETIAEEFLNLHSKKHMEISFDGDVLNKVEYTGYGKIILREKRIKVTDDDYVEAICQQVEIKGTDFLPLNNETNSFLKRVQFYLENNNSDKKTMDVLQQKIDSLSVLVREWLPPFIVPGKKISAKTVYDALYYFLEGTTVDKKVPKVLLLPNGKKRSVNYENQNGKIIPVLEIIIQQLFGCLETPRILGIPVLLKLLSPARRPLQITSDLENFWKETWPEICLEMKGRYPKHNWDYHIVSDEE